MLTLAEEFAPFLPDVPEVLIDRQARQGIEGVLLGLPPGVTKHLILELRLGAVVNRVVDTSLVVASAENLLRITESHPDWPEVLVTLAQHWQSQTSQETRLRQVWLEVDRGARHPCVFACHKSDRMVDPSERQALLATTAVLCEGMTQAERVRQGLDELLSRTPVPLLRLHLGRMFSRSDQALRVCLSRFSTAQVLPALDAWGWPGEREQVQPLLLGDEHGSYMLDLDLAAGLRGSLGLEWHPVRNALEDWGACITRLEARELCTDEQAQALRRLGRVKEYRDQDGTTKLAFVGLDHFKLQLGLLAPTLKAYVSVRIGGHR